MRPPSSGTTLALDLVALAGEQLREHVAAPVLAHALRDPVRHGEDGGLHSFVFSTSRTASTTMPLSTALAMS